ncbi:hypothetical protein BD626DRAFT_511377 [Schizophyllum amplum]|uniref:Uncharacterized protein n=1 Tax=Schizophyllum amplum TaxID=97359 RepID=A0A550C173_9AGAR|nr:hypothetical protein BD626DRAFT_511377 [Auriculariopsis ampla]
MALPILTHSRSGFPLITTETPKLRKRGGINKDGYLTLYPRYCYGWIFSDKELEAMSMERFGHPDAHKNALLAVRERWEAAGGSPDDLDYTHKRLGQHSEIFLYVSDNTTRKKLNRPSDAEFLAKAKAATGKEEDGKWYHMDTF